MGRNRLRPLHAGRQRGIRRPASRPLGETAGKAGPRYSACARFGIRRPDFRAPGASWFEKG
jgi:hypothetical protein